MLSADFFDLIEEYKEHSKYGAAKKYDVRKYASLDSIKEAYLKGRKHNGTLKSTKGLEVKLLRLEPPEKPNLEERSKSQK